MLLQILPFSIFLSLFFYFYSTAHFYVIYMMYTCNRNHIFLIFITTLWCLEFFIIIGYTYYHYINIKSIVCLIMIINRILEFRTPQSSLHFLEWFNFPSPHCYHIKKENSKQLIYLKLLTNVQGWSKIANKEKSEIHLEFRKTRQACACAVTHTHTHSRQEKMHNQM